MPPIHWGATDAIEDGLTRNNAPTVCRVHAPFPQRQPWPGKWISQRGPPKKERRTTSRKPTNSAAWPKLSRLSISARSCLRWLSNTRSLRIAWITASGSRVPCWRASRALNLHGECYGGSRLAVRTRRHHPAIVDGGRDRLGDGGPSKAGDGPARP